MSRGARRSSLIPHPSSLILQAAPAGIPDPVLRRLNTAAVEALKTPDLSSKLRASGFEPSPTSPEQFREFIRAESAKFQKIIADAGITLEQ